MSRFAEVDDQYDPDAVEDRVFDYWDEVDAYERTVEHRADGEDFFFVDGPPYTSGSAHMGTTWNKTLKDAYIRYHRMRGYNVTDRPGYDMHGLPIETKVEERLGFDNKKDIEEFGEQNFIDECKSFAEEQLEGLQEDFKSFGVWMDWDDPYKTVDPEYMEAAWWGFSKAHDRDLVEQGQRSISQCPRCETAIANNEVEYDHVEDPSIYVKFPLAEREGHLVIWTTTPWTVPANTFVAVDEEMTYQAIEVDTGDGTETLYVGEPCVEDVVDHGGYEDYEVVGEHEGSDLVGWRYEHPLREEVPEAPAFEGALEVYGADYVEADRTGLVHSAPGHGEVDFERGQELGLSVFCPVGPDGVYEDAAGDYAGQFVKDADAAIMDDLEAKGLLLSRGTVNHDYGHCWRCDTPIIQMVTDQWFITVTDIKDELLANMEESEWFPQEARDNRFRSFIEESPDWNVSRQRYWGIPIPIWTPDDWSGDVEEAIVVSTREELAERVDQDIDPESVDLHKDTVDDLTITADGTTYTRVPDVFDVWLDSSVASWGTLGYPGNEDDFEELWPADLIMEAHDQTRGWFWSQLGMGSAALGEAPYETVLMHGWALAEDGRKMSKSIGNIVAPQEAIDRHGADPMRLFLLTQNPQGDDMRFSWDEMENRQRDLNILWNVFRFPLPYMRLDDFDPDAVALDEAALETVDEWVLSRLSTVTAEMTDHWENFRQDKALDELLAFIVEDVSRFYIQVVRERMWEEETSESKLAAYATLHHVLVETTKLLAPYAPFVAEEIYGTLTGDGGHETVHMADWPDPDERFRDPQLETDVDIVAAVEEAGSNARQQAERKLRWPVTRVVVAADDDRAAEAVDRHRDLLRDRLNAREIELVEPGSDWEELSYTARADMSVLGPTFGDEAGEVMNAINAVSVTDTAVEALEAAVETELGRDIELTDEMVSFNTETPEGVEGTAFTVDGDDRGVVYVDTALTEDIESEGYAREVIRRVQEMRKDLDLDIEAEIRVDLDIADERVATLVDEHEGLIADEVRAAEFADLNAGHERVWDVESTDITITIDPVSER
ncbi:isoleucine--tRNA ligase [Natronomonas pharaonis DSM 2160]|uniref:Isoleucine--tRNA ligase n=1 Tax=Natronomonas pharaonis (strain ATCC 35678 / DSM 2160 / CIP 103997 / JCM 8858 / NBRC 14720 / NCIMB 2260 / Gabara) TaxID=348780 RepID=SYI_NATPD|nr:isoleucine--tRNA ligase [Natronomonas pharaonis]Q3ITY7.1 RecName: Full=Isoleucine--tRNA ligase; AltName: Full=Isoleucyl-tRNA synthetase; Short=IleRS [Natronomonas pharaonis DSM 2160]CAI48396.1 isoleucine--tRNA ligase [Natronomonas pharaonis DSM 2160]